MITTSRATQPKGAEKPFHKLCCFCYRRHSWPGGIRYFCIRWHMGRVGWVGWGWWRCFHLHTCDMLRTWRFLHLHTCDMLWTWKSESKRRSVKFASVSHNKMQFTKWHSKTRLTGTQTLDKVWSHLKKHVSKSLCSRSKSDRRFNPRMEQYVYSYMWRFNNRNWWKQLGQLCQQHWQKENTSANEVFFFSVLPTSQSKITKIELRTQFWRVFYTSVKIQNRKKRGN